MKFNIARLDKVLLIQTLYLHADPKGYGEIEYARLMDAGEPVEGVSTHACRDMLKQGARLRTGYLVDYYNGKPLKIEWNKITPHQVIMDSAQYDLIHGKYRFLEALLNVFHPEEIWIADKNYSPVQGRNFAESNRIIKELEMEQLLDETVLIQHNKRGAYWTFDPANTKYTSEFLNGLDLSF